MRKSLEPSSSISLHNRKKVKIGRTLPPVPQQATYSFTIHLTMPPGDAPVLKHSAPHHRRGNRPDPNSGLRLGVERRSDSGRGSEGRLLPAAAICAARRSGSHELCPAQPIRGQIPGVPKDPTPSCSYTPGPASSHPPGDPPPRLPSPFQKPLAAP